MSKATTDKNTPGNAGAPENTGKTGQAGDHGNQGNRPGDANRGQNPQTGGQRDQAGGSRGHQQDQPFKQGADRGDRGDPTPGRAGRHVGSQSGKEGDERSSGGNYQGQDTYHKSGPSHDPSATGPKQPGATGTRTTMPTDEGSDEDMPDANPTTGSKSGNKAY